MNKKNLVVISALLVLLVGVGAVVSSLTNQQSTADGKFKITASFYPVYYFASKIGGDRAHVTNIAPPGADPHDFEPSPKDIATIYESQLFVLNGAGFEAWAERVLKELPASVAFVEAGENLATLPHEEEHEDEVSEDGSHTEEIGHGEYDPHVWLSPKLAIAMIDSVLAGMSAADPQNAVYYQENAALLRDEISKLDADFAAGLARCEKNVFITSHAAFGYIARDYNLRQVAITGLAHEAEPSAKEIAEIAELARENRLTHVFFETLVSPKLSETIASEAGAQTLVLNPLEGLTQEEIEMGADYVSVMRANLDNLRTALACS